MGGSITVAFLDRFADAGNRHDAATILTMMTTDCAMCPSGGPDPDGRRLIGPEAVCAGTTALFRDLPDAQWNGATHFIAGDGGVSQWVFTATRPDGTRANAVGCDVFTFRDGLIAVKDSYRKQVAH